MITRTTKLTDTYLMRVKAAVGRALAKANKPMAVRGIGHADVYNRNGKYSLQIVARRGGIWEAFDSADRDVTGVLLDALRTMHTRRQVVEKPARLAHGYQTFLPSLPSLAPLWECRA